MSEADRSAAPIGGVVLLYHRVTHLRSDPQLLAVMPARFSEHLRVIQRLGHPMALRAMAAAAKEQTLPRRAIAMTFDDGYADNLQQAAPLLRNHRVPATVFVATGRTGTTEEFFWDELDRLLLQPGSLPSELTITVGDSLRRFDLQDCERYTPQQLEADRGWDVTQPARPSSRQQLYLDLCGAIHQMPADARAAALSDLRRQAGVDSAGRASHRMMTADELRELADDGLIDVGAHTIEHPLLSVETGGRQRTEIAGSKQSLEAILGRAVAGFSYPFGGRRDYTAETVSAVREAGFTFACSNFPGHVTADTDPLQLPRFVVRDWDAARFAAQLSVWLAPR